MIQVIRKKKFNNCIRKFKVVVDGDTIAKIKNGQTISLNLEEGRHTMKLVIDWCSSNTITFDVTNDKEIIFTCYPNANNRVLNLIARINSYLILETAEHYKPM